MKNKIFPIFVTLLLIFLPLGDVSAQGLSKNKPATIARAVLRDLETGKKVDLQVIAKQYTINGLDATSYEVIIVAGLLTKSSSHFDSTASIRVTLSQFYSEHVIGNRSVSVDRYEAKWEKFDNTVTIRDAYIRPAVLGYSEGGQYYNTSYTASIGTPSLNTWYITYPSWRGVYIVINDFSYQASSVHSKLVRGGSTWYLDFCVAQGGRAVISCD